MSPTTLETDSSVASVRALAVPADEKLVERTLAGDLSAFEALVQRYQAVVHRVAARIVGLSDADDVTQDTFLRAFHRLGQFGRDPAPASRGGGRRPPRGVARRRLPPREEAHRNRSRSGIRDSGR